MIIAVMVRLLMHSKLARSFASLYRVPINLYGSALVRLHPVRKSLTLNQRAMLRASTDTLKPPVAIDPVLEPILTAIDPVLEPKLTAVYPVIDPEPIENDTISQEPRGGSITISALGGAVIIVVSIILLIWLGTMPEVILGWVIYLPIFFPIIFSPKVG